MRVIPVLDLRGGRAVHARGGERARYAPVRSAVVPAAAPGDALALARGYRDMLGLPDRYVADLDALGGGAPDAALIGALAALGGKTYVDAGVATAKDAATIAAAGAGCMVVVGLETLPALAGLGALGEVATSVGRGRVAFSLDLRGGVPLAREPALRAASPEDLARRARDAGAGAVILLDLGRVGRDAGLDLALLDRVRAAVPDVELYVGGGVRDAGDLARLAGAGADGALVATALHEGRIGLSALAHRRSAPESREPLAESPGQSPSSR